MKVIFLDDNWVLDKYITGKQDVEVAGNILAVKITLISFHDLFIINWINRKTQKNSIRHLAKKKIVSIYENSFTIVKSLARKLIDRY